MKFTFGEIASATNGRLTGGDDKGEATGASVDTRTIKPGEIFFALKGPRFDGHDFLEEAAKRGSSCAVVQRSGGFAPPPLPPDFGVIEVEDTLVALGDLAAYARKKHPVPLVAITGTAGKTTTKDMAAAILSKRGVLKTDGNRNNLIGMPLTLIGLEPGHRAAVIELGISKEDEMARMAEICSPDVALITNIGMGHLEGLGNVEKVAEEKGKLFYAVAGSGVMVINLDDPWTVKMAEEALIGVEGEAEGWSDRVTYGSAPGADVLIKEHSEKDLSGSEALFEVRGEEIPVKLNYPGFMNVVNAAAAIASTLPVGAGAEEIAEGLESLFPSPGRMSVLNLDGITMIDDSYNSNPDSLAAALSVLSAAEGRKVAVLGEMLELGDEAEEAHIDAGREAAKAGVEMLVAVGGWAGEVAEGAAEEGIPSSLTHKCKDLDEALDLLDGILVEGDTVLVKGSRGTELEGVVHWFKTEHGHS